jgi:putative membrane protein
MLLDMNGAWHMGNGTGWWMVFGSVMMVIFWIVIIWAVTAVVRRPPESGARERRSEPTALQILERRYALGELTDDEFESMKRRLTGSGSAPA